MLLKGLEGSEPNVQALILNHFGVTHVALYASRAIALGGEFSLRYREGFFSLLFSGVTLVALYASRAISPLEARIYVMYNIYIYIYIYVPYIYIPWRHIYM